MGTWLHQEQPGLDLHDGGPPDRGKCEWLRIHLLRFGRHSRKVDMALGDSLELVLIFLSVLHIGRRFPAVGHHSVGSG